MALDLTAAQRLADEGLTASAIARKPGAKRWALYEAIKTGRVRCAVRDYSARGSNKAMIVEPPRPTFRPHHAASLPGAVSPPRLSQLIATGGRYAPLVAWAAAWGVTVTQAQQEWHRLGLPLRRGGRG